MTPLEQCFQETSEKMDKTCKIAVSELAQVRTGRASTGFVEGVKVDYYNTPTPLKQLATISTPEPRQILIQPFDPTSVESIERALMKSDLGITPQSDGKVLRIFMPELTSERREELMKLVRKMAENGRVSLRAVRRDANDRVKQLEKDSEVTEDDSRRGLERIQKLTDDHIKQIDQWLSEKEKELSEF